MLVNFRKGFSSKQASIPASVFARTQNTMLFIRVTSFLSIWCSGDGIEGITSRALALQSSVTRLAFGW